jgi:hypothetical protein
MSTNPESLAADRIVDLLIAGLKDPDGRVHAEDLISAAAAIVGERCIEAAGDFDARQHDLPPGSHVFSDAVNDLLAGDVSTNLDDLPRTSVFGTLRDELLPNGYTRFEFPKVEDVFKAFAAGIGKPEDWGWVPLSVSQDNRPFLQPLRAAYETRAGVDEILTPFRNEPTTSLKVVTHALAKVLITVRQAIQPSVALLLALETVNGMAKTTPVTDQVFLQMAKDVVPPKKDQSSKRPWWKLW